MACVRTVLKTHARSVAALFIAAGFVGLRPCPANAGTILVASDTRLDLGARAGVALVGTHLHSATSTDVDVYNSTNISGSAEDWYLTQSSGLTDMASSSNRLFQVIGGKVYEVDEDGEYIDDFSASTSSGADFDAIGFSRVNGTNYVVGIDFGTGECRAYDVDAPLNFTDLATITNVPGDAAGMDTYLQRACDSLDRLVVCVCSQNGIGQYQHGEKIENETVYINGLDGNLSDVHLDIVDGGRIQTYFVTDVSGVAGETGTTSNSFERYGEPLEIVGMSVLSTNDALFVEIAISWDSTIVTSNYLERSSGETNSAWAVVSSWSGMVGSTNLYDEITNDCRNAQYRLRVRW